jgi:hypothetical protein
MAVVMWDEDNSNNAPSAWTARRNPSRRSSSGTPDWGSCQAPEAETWVALNQAMPTTAPRVIFVAASVDPDLHALDLGDPGRHFVGDPWSRRQHTRLLLTA